MPKTQIDRNEAAAMAQLLTGAWVARIIHTTAELGIVDHLGDDPKDARSLALARLLRALAAIGLLHETEDRGYMLTTLGATLRSDRAGSMRGWARLILSEMDESPWRSLTHTVQTGDYAFQHALGSDAA